MRILIVNTQWTGSSTGKIAYGFYRRLKENGHEVILAYGMGEKKRDDINVRKITPRIESMIHFRYNLVTGYHGKFGPISYYRLKKIIREFKPDIVQLYNLHGYYMNIFRFLKYLASNSIPTVYGMLDEYPYLGYCCYAYDCVQFKTGCQNCQFAFIERYMKSYFFNRAKQTLQMKSRIYNCFEKLVFTGPLWVTERAKQSLLLEEKDVRVLDEYIDTKDTFFIRDTAELRKELNISDDKIILLDVAPSGDERKGVRFFVDLARRFAHDDRYVFINVGYQNNFSNIPSNFLGIPFVKDQNRLAEFYSLADLFICTSMADTMPNSCLDAMACGTPICGFDITGIPYVAEEPIGKFVDPGDVNALVEIVSCTSRKSKSLVEVCRKYAEERYSLDVYYDKQMVIYNELNKSKYSS